MELIEKYVGKWGRYQAFLYALFALPFAISGIQVMAFNFTGAVPEHRCFLPGLDDRENPDYNAPFRNGTANVTYFKPKKVSGKWAYCYYCSDALNLAAAPHPECTSSQKVPCSHGYVYDKSQFRSTLVADFDMVCDGGVWKRSMASSFFMVGFLTGAAVSGTLSDRYGRRPVFLAFSFLGIITYHLIILVPNLPVLCIFHVLNGSFCHGAYITGFVIVMEYIGGLWGTICGIWVQGMFAIGYIFVGVCAYLIRDWKWLQFAISLPSIFLIPYFWLIPESVRWLVTHGRKSQAKEVILRAARWNRMTINENELDRDIDCFTICENATAFDLFRDKALAKVTVIVFYSWFATSMIYYGLSLNSSALPGNEYGIYILLGFIEFPAYIIAIPMMEKWGRRPTIVVAFGFGGLALVISTFLPQSVSWLIITLASIGKIGAAASFAVIYNYSAELFPTVARNAGIGGASCCARVASISAPQIYLLAEYAAPWVPFLIYGAVSIIAAFADLFLPETLGLPLPETMQDGADLANKVSIWDSVTSLTGRRRVTPELSQHTDNKSEKETGL